MNGSADKTFSAQFEQIEGLLAANWDALPADLPCWIEQAKINNPNFQVWVRSLQAYLSHYGAARFAIDLREIIPGSKIAIFCRPNADELADHEACLGKLDSEQVDVLFDHDPWLWNLAKSIWECAKGETKLTAYPWNFSIPIADVCNARCIFCTSWLEGRELVTLEQIDALKEPIKRALYVGLVGHGEPMSHPKFREIAARLRSYLDRRALFTQSPMAISLRNISKNSKASM